VDFGEVSFRKNFFMELAFFNFLSDVLGGDNPNRGRIANQMPNHNLSASVRSRGRGQALTPVRLSEKGHWSMGSSSGCSVSPGFVGEENEAA
jgi:hypothetical protein